ncbi:hypothetical protein [Nocardia xishanensis]
MSSDINTHAFLDEPVSAEYVAALGVVAVRVGPGTLVLDPCDAGELIDILITGDSEFVAYVADLGMVAVKLGRGELWLSRRAADELVDHLRAALDVYAASLQAVA